MSSHRSKHILNKTVGEKTG